MSLPIVFRQRFRGFIGRVTKKPPQPFPGATTLLAATMFDDTNLDIIFRRALNRDDRIGMGDVLKQPFGPGELKGSTRIDEVLTTIGKRSLVSSVSAYRDLIGPRVADQLAVILAGAHVPPRDPTDVKPTDPLSDYVTPINVDNVAKECNVGLDKWLLSPVAINDFADNLTVAGALDNLLSRIVVL